MCLWWVGGTGSGEKDGGGGNITPPGPRRRKRQLEQLRSLLHASVFLLLPSTTPSSHPFLPPLNPHPTTPPHPRRCSSAWPGAPGFPQSLTGPGEGEGHRNGRDWVPHCNQVQGALGKSKNGLFFLPITAVGGVGAGEVRFHTSFLFLPRPPPTPDLGRHSLRSWALLVSPG